MSWGWNWKMSGVTWPARYARDLRDQSRNAAGEMDGDRRDYKRSLDDLLKLQYELQQDGIQAALEQSRRGGHLWILFETPVLAKHARVYIRHLAGKLRCR